MPKDKKKQSLTGPIIIGACIIVSGLIVAAAVYFQPGKEPESVASTAPTPTDPSEVRRQALSEDQQEASSAANTELREAALLQEELFAARGSYAMSIAELYNQGFETGPGMTLTIATVEENRYCLEAVHDAAPDVVFSYDNSLGEVMPTRCEINT